MLTFKLPSQLYGLAGGRKTIDVEAATLGEAFRQLDTAAPMLRSQLFDGNGNVRQFVGLFLNNRQVTAVGADDQPVHEGSLVTIVMAVAGG